MLPLRMDFADPETAPTILPFTKFEIRGGIRDALGAPARLCHRNSQSRTVVAKRISGGGESDSERPDQGSPAPFRRRKGDAGRDRSPPGSKRTGGRGGNRSEERRVG